RWREVELMGDLGLAPQVMLRGRTKEQAEERGITEVWASLSHEKEFAVAAVVLTGSGKGDRAFPERESLP
ncbi:MAG: hypothetical protein QHH30_01775, partial [candidate division NC10 bacterium]|nr:hypothetical protein [candidate division NC10 bacterium]